MQDSAIIQASIDLLQVIFNENRPADDVARHYFKTRRYIGSKDRKYISENVFHVLRFKLSLAWWVEKNLVVEPRSLILTLLLLKQKRGFAEIAQLFSGAQYSPKRLSLAEKDYLQALEEQSYYNAAMPFHIRWDIPHWSEDLLKGVFGKTVSNELEAMLTNAPLDVRVNTLVSSNAEAELFFNAHKIDFQKLDGAANAYRIARGTALSQTSYFQSGGLEVQDLGSQMIVEACAVEPKMQVLDYCAGAGGKTLGLAAQMANKGAIVACDISSHRLKQCKLRLKRAGVQNTTVRHLDQQGAQWLKRQKNRFDCVLLDVPCSGSGTWRRNPDLKWRLADVDLTEILLVQKKILQQAAPLIKQGGKLIYATCSLFQLENENQINDFVEEYPEFTLVKQSRLSPCTTGTDGFFYAVLVRGSR